MKQVFLTVAAISGAFCVSAGAFGAHALRGTLSERSLQIFDVGVRYQMYHTLALLAIAILISTQATPSVSLITSGWLFILGIILFSGSLYALSLTNITILGIITPVGGVVFILGWLILALSSWNFQG
ncbi:DUF423 domain-containing protein [Calothrix sp. 336/3]|uniref:DUF423 domain-containing protein n=1 Tax=Calothrix sp. 336/3 TaxID=1337936 RepID=UPI0004E41C51|nr:DUF423 domain-containing protein [Calothrix sp. 336/3]AKG19925.1 hypothetical protein IJ00_00065 [Calothrix sp. 336/3]